MTRGRKPKPTHLKIVIGNPGRRPLKEDAIQPEVRDEPPAAPAFLKGEARAEWKRLAPALCTLGLLSILDMGAFASYCLAFGRLVQTEKLLANLAQQDASGRDAILIKTKTGGVAINPAIWLARASASDVVRYAAEFGFTPSSRSRITATGPIHGGQLTRSSNDHFFD